ncbi:MAG: hypothetical protein H6R07_1168 [Proteobacteria bacterium]|nr:hypothetical protein [Pseudomonadota bacterium]
MSDALAKLTAARLSDAGIEFVTVDLDGLRIPAREPVVGDILVLFEGGEVSVFLGDITHCHFTPDQADDKFPCCTAEQAAKDAAQFIREVVEDKWVLWCWNDGRGGCFKPDGNDEEAADSPLPGEEVKYFRWSGSFVPSNTSLERTRG